MKTKNLFLVSLVVFFGATFESYGQNNTSIGGVDPSPGWLNVRIGYLAGNSLVNNSAVSANIFIGPRAGFNNTDGEYNTFLGYQAGLENMGVQNTLLGALAGQVDVGVSGSYNTHVGFSAGFASYGDENTTLGWAAGNNLRNRNVSIGYRSGYRCQGDGNVFIGYRAADFVGNENINNRLFIENGTTLEFAPLVYGEFDNRKLRFYVNDGVDAFSSFTEITGNVDASGLKFTNLKSDSPLSDSNGVVLTVNEDGHVILVKDVYGTGDGTTFTSTCADVNFVPKSTGPDGMTCSQIFDNGTSVGIGSTSNFSWTSTPSFVGSLGSIPSSGTLKLDVNGITRVTSIFATSDKKFKKDIQPIENALATVQLLEGKNYLWNKESNREMNFDDGGHSGFIAQDIEKILPHLVITGENGYKAVNYIELLPYLVEAIKEQQTQINDLKAQISENFKAQNQDLIELTNTKIINVSPNPSNDVITISFNVEKSVQVAKMQVHDLNGNIISSLQVNDRENNITRTLQKDNFGKGIYVVSLVINGKSIDTKKIVFN